MFGFTSSQSQQNSSNSNNNQNANSNGAFSFFDSIFNPVTGFFSQVGGGQQQQPQQQQRTFNTSSSSSSQSSSSSSSSQQPQNMFPMWQFNNYAPQPQQQSSQQFSQQQSQGNRPQQNQQRTQQQSASTNNNYPRFGNSQSQQYSSSSQQQPRQQQSNRPSQPQQPFMQSNQQRPQPQSQQNRQPQQQQQQQQPQQQPQNVQEDDVRPTFMSTRNGWRKATEEQKKEKKKEIPKEDTSDFWKQKGTELAKKGYTDSAIECYTKAISIDGSQSIYYSNRGRCYKNKGDWKRAFDDAVQAMELDDRNLKGHLLCGQVLCQMGKEEQGYVKIENGIKKLTKGLTLCASQAAKSKKKEFEKDISMYIFRAKKLLWYKKYQEQREKKKKLIDNYRVYLEQISSLNDDERQAQMDDFIFTVGDPFKEFDFTVPDHLSCKITLDLIEDPVTTEAGHTYEREVIEDHFKKNGCIDPFTRNPVKPVLYPNLAIKQGVQEFLEKNPWAYEYQYNEDYRDIEF